METERERKGGCTGGWIDRQTDRQGYKQHMYSKHSSRLDVFTSELTVLCVSNSVHSNLKALNVNGHFSSFFLS